MIETYGKVKAKYDRRIKRQLDQIECSKNVLIVYLQIPNDRSVVNNDILIISHNKLKRRFPQQNITLLYIYCNHGSQQIKFEEIQEGLIKTEYDYDAYIEAVPYAVNDMILQKQICKIKLTRKFITYKNLCRRYIYLTKCFFIGML